MQHDGEYVRTERSHGVGRITLERPAKRNALSLAIVRELSAALAAWASDPDVRAVPIEGSGARGFCADADIGSLHGVARGGHRQRSAPDVTTGDLAEVTPQHVDEYVTSLGEEELRL